MIKVKKLFKKLHKLGFFLKILRSTWPVLFPRGSYAKKKKTAKMFTTFFDFFCHFFRNDFPI